MDFVQYAGHNLVAVKSRDRENNTEDCLVMASGEMGPKIMGQ